MAVLLACTDVECGRGRVHSENQSNEPLQESTSNSPQQGRTVQQSFEPVAISTASATRRPARIYEPVTPGALIRTDSDNGDNENISDHDGESEDTSASTNNHFYNAIMNGIPSGLTRSFNGITNMLSEINGLVEQDQLNRYSDYQVQEQDQEQEFNVAQSQSCGESSQEMDSSMFITRGSSNNNPSTTTNAAITAPLKPENDFNEDSVRISERINFPDVVEQTSDENVEIFDEHSVNRDDHAHNSYQQSYNADTDQDEMFNITHPIEFDNYFNAESTPTAAAIQIAESSLSGSAARLRSNSPYVRSSRVNSVDSVNLTQVEMDQISELGRRVEENQTSSLFNDIDLIASEKLQEIGHVGLQILSQLLTQITYIPLEPGTNSLQQSSDLLEQLSNVFLRVAKYCKRKKMRLDYCELIQWCLNATCMRNSYPDRYRLVRDAILLLILNNPAIFDEVYLKSEWAVYSFKVAVIYSSLLRYHDSLDYIRQIYDCLSLSQLLIILELPDLFPLPSDNSEFLPLRQVYLNNPRPNVLNQTPDNFYKKRRNTSVKPVKKTKKRYQLSRILINVASLLLYPVINYPGESIIALVLAIIFQIFFFHGK